MNPEDIKSILKRELSDCEILVEIDGSHVNIVAVGDLFEGKRPVQRQQMVYKALNDQIASGAIHAVHMKVFTHSEWKQRT